MRGTGVRGGRSDRLVVAYLGGGVPVAGDDAEVEITLGVADDHRPVRDRVEDDGCGHVLQASHDAGGRRRLGTAHLYFAYN